MDEAVRFFISAGVLIPEHQQVDLEDHEKMGPKEVPQWPEAPQASLTSIRKKVEDAISDTVDQDDHEENND